MIGNWIPLLLSCGLAQAPSTTSPASVLGGAGQHAGDTVLFLDGLAPRALVRHEDARAAGRSRATFMDPLTGRSAKVTVGPEAVVVARGPERGALLREWGLEVVRSLMPSRGIVLVRSVSRREDGADVAQRLRPLVQQGKLERVVPDLAFSMTTFGIHVPPDDTRYRGQTYLEDIAIEDAWALSVGDDGTLILVADNGCDLDHPDLVDKMDLGYDPIDDDDDPSWEPGDGSLHGTACAGLAAASTDNGLDIAGACPLCRLSCARLLPADGEPVTVASDVLTFQFALDVDAAVVSNSWGFTRAIPVPGPLKDAIIEVQQNGRGGLGAVVVFAAGNDDRLLGNDELLAVDGILGVGAVSNVGALTQYTNYGPSVDVVAPTGSVTLDIAGADGAEAGDTTSVFNGTSSACPIVAGVAALIVSAAPDLTADEINQILMDTAHQSALADPDEDGHDPGYGYGLIQAGEALQVAVGEDDTPGGDDGDITSCDATHGRGCHSAVSGVLGALWLMVRCGARRRRA